MQEKIRSQMMALRGIEDQDNPVIAFAAKRSHQMVQAYLGLGSVPEALLEACVEIGLGLWDMSESANRAAEGQIQSITEGDSTVRYFQDADSVSREEEMLLTSVRGELNRFRQVQW